MKKTAGRALRLIMNGGAAVDPQVREAVAQVRALGHKIEPRALWEPGDGCWMAEEAARSGCEVIVAAGGDGTLNEVLNGMLRAPTASLPALALMPFGTANDFAETCGVPEEGNPTEALLLAAEGAPRLVDVGRVNDRFFLNVVSGGFGAEITAATAPELKQLLGEIAYSITGVANLLSLHPRPLRLTSPNFNWEGSALVLAVGNGRMAGGGYRVTPHALLNDGLLDVLIAPELPPNEFVVLLAEFLTGNAEDDEHLIYRRVKSLRVEAPEGLHVNVDGEPLHCREYDFSLHDRQIPLIVGPGAPLVEDPGESQVGDDVRQSVSDSRTG